MSSGRNGLYLGIAAFTATVFAVETQIPLGFTPWLLYVIPLGLTFWAPYLYAPLVMATVCTVLVAVDYFLSPAGVPAHIALTNRAIGTLIFWVLGLLIVQYKLLADRLSQLTKTLATELKERTRDLGFAVSALQAELEHRHRTEHPPSESRTELHRQVTNVLTAEGRRLREKVARYDRIEQSEQEGEEGLDNTREELVQLGHRLEQLQRELLENEKDRA